jgi:hypothetical protein
MPPPLQTQPLVLQLQAAGTYLILQVIQLRHLVIRGDLPVKFNHELVLLLVGLALVAK